MSGKTITILIVTVAVAMIVSGCIMLKKTEGHATTKEAWAGGILVFLGLIIIGAGYTGVIGSLMEWMGLL